MRLFKILLFLIINSLLILIVSIFLENSAIEHKGLRTRSLMETAADMALEHLGQTDEFFIKDGEDGSFNINIQGVDGKYTNMNMYEAIYNSRDKSEIFLKLFDTPDFKAFSRNLSNMRIPFTRYNKETNTFKWYTYPRIASVGLDILPSHKNVREIKGYYDNSIMPEGEAQEFYRDMGLNTHLRHSGRVYCVSPLNLGVTYINRQLLSAMFINNMDLLMRNKYAKNDKDLNEEEGGNGIYKGSTYANKITANLDEYNPINNGEFTLLRGEELEGTESSIKAYKGILPDIKYKVIDMYDPQNDILLSILFGAKKTTEDGQTFDSKAEYLKYMDRDILNHVDNQPYNEKLIVVAQVTFYLDVIVPFTTTIIRGFRTKLDPPENNFIDLHRDNGGKKAFSGNDLLTYTRYFAVTP